MLGILLIYFIGKYYYDLAALHDKRKWVYAGLGIVSYYAGTMLFGLAFGVFMEIWSPGTLDTMNNTVLGLIALPVGVLSCYGVYTYLRKKWEGKAAQALDIIDEIGS